MTHLTHVYLYTHTQRGSGGFPPSTCKAGVPGVTCVSAEAPRFRAHSDSRNTPQSEITRPGHPAASSGQPVRSLKTQPFGAVPGAMATAETAFRGNHAATHRIKSPMGFGGAS